MEGEAEAALPETLSLPVSLEFLPLGCVPRDPRDVLPGSGSKQTTDHPLLGPQLISHPGNYQPLTQEHSYLSWLGRDRVGWGAGREDRSETSGATETSVKGP